MKRFLPLNSIIILLLLLVTGIANSQNSNQELKITDYVIPYPRQLEKSGDELLYFVADLNVKYTGKTSERLSEYAARTPPVIVNLISIYAQLYHLKTIRNPRSRISGKKEIYTNFNKSRVGGVLGEGRHRSDLLQYR